MYTHTHIRIHIQTYMSGYVRTYVDRLHIHYAHIHLNYTYTTHTYTYIHIHTQSYTCIHIHTYTHTHIYLYIHIHTHTHTHPYTCTHSRPRFWMPGGWCQEPGTSRTPCSQTVCPCILWVVQWVFNTADMRDFLYVLYAGQPERDTSSDRR